MFGITEAVPIAEPFRVSRILRVDLSRILELEYASSKGKLGSDENSHVFCRLYRFLKKCEVTRYEGHKKIRRCAETIARVKREETSRWGHVKKRADEDKEARETVRREGREQVPLLDGLEGWIFFMKGF